MTLIRLFLAIMLAGFITSAHALTTEEREAFEAKQAELDRQCEEVRDGALSPERLAMITSCMSALIYADSHIANSEEFCQRTVSNSLPECVAAFDHRRTEINEFKK